METVIDSKEAGRRVFISYCTSDRRRVDGLERLLVLFGHKVFLDFKQIRLGSRWKDEITSALDQTDITLVYWTRSASSSVWVRNEYEYFLAQHPSRPLVPIVGDETPLSEPLKERQAMTFVPVINELLELKRSMEEEGRTKAEIRDSILKRLEQAGIQLKDSDANRIFRFFGIAGWMAWLPAPLVLFAWVWRSMFEAAALLSPAQGMLVLAVAAGAAAITGQMGSNRLANHLEQARTAYTQLERQAKEREQDLANQLNNEHTAKSQLEREAKEREEVLKLADSKSLSNALLEVASNADPALLRFVDSATGQHRFTVQIPSREDFSFWIPKGTYRVYIADTDISDNIPQLIGGDVKRRLQEITLDSQMNYTYEPRQVEDPAKTISPEEWGRVPDDKP